ncbi:MAG: nitronate monooxygenase [Flavobacteriales bacterium]|jgi:enoyl-[acyl-carrier protein] reductase II|nr:nitronate monooxygenase [Flavobacteriales bacterium]
MSNKICDLFGIKHPIIQGGMIWCSGWELASAVSNQGGLGILGAGSMYPEILKEQIQKCKAATDKPFAVNLPLLYPNIEEHIQTILEEKIPVVFTSAGSPKKYTSYLQSHGIKVVHVVSNVKFAIKCEEAGVDAVVAEGFEAGGHNGREETTTLCLIPQVRKAISIPLIAAGGIGSGEAIFATMSLGADGVQIGSRFAASQESSAHENFKNAIVDAKEGDTMLMLKELTPVRLLKNPFFDQVVQAYENDSSIEELKELLGRGRAKKGMFLGDLIDGELEIGQVSASIDRVETVAEIFDDLIKNYTLVKEKSKQFTI